MHKEEDAVYYLSRTARPWALIVGLQPNTYYFVKVMAYNAAGEGPESERFEGMIYCSIYGHVLHFTFEKNFFSWSSAFYLFLFDVEMSIVKKTTKNVVRSYLSKNVYVIIHNHFFIFRLLFINMYGAKTISISLR